MCIVLASGCGKELTRVLAPQHTARPTVDRLRRANDPEGQIPCNPSYAGPVLTLFGPGLEFHYPTGGYCPTCPGAEVPIDVPEGRTVTIRWSADASGGCTDIRWFRWALDIADLFDQTPRIDEATDLSHWSAPSLASSATVGPFTITQGAPNVHYLLIDAADGVGYRSLGILRINVVAAVNHPPEIQLATAELIVEGAPNGGLSPIRVDGVTDPDGDAITIAVTGITQDEPLLGRGNPPTCPDARIDGGAASVRRERSGFGNGRVYTIEFVATDGHGGASHGTAEVCIPRDRSSGGCIRDPLVVNSLDSCEPSVASQASSP